MMPVHDQPGLCGLGQLVDRGDAVAMARRSLVRDQDIETLPLQVCDIFGKDRIAMPEWQAVAPALMRLQASEEFPSSLEAWGLDRAARFVDARIPDARLEHTGKPRDPQPAHLHDLAANV